MGGEWQQKLKYVSTDGSSHKDEDATTSNGLKMNQRRKALGLDCVPFAELSECAWGNGEPGNFKVEPHD